MVDETDLSPNRQRQEALQRLHSRQLAKMARAKKTKENDDERLGKA
jgi:hypothetical protein